jgi:hypothetical protein
MESTYSVLAGGVSAWGLGRMGARGGFGSGGLLGKPPASGGGGGTTGQPIGLLLALTKAS